MKYFFLICIGVLAFLTLFLYLIELLTSKPAFNILNFTINYAISLPFMMLLLLADYGLVVFINRTSKLSANQIRRIAFEGMGTVILAALLVIIGNLPFCGNLAAYLASADYWQSVVAAILINVFTVTAIEFFVQNRKNQQLMQENMQMQYRQLKGQINPHFLFNSLNAIISLINKDSQQAAACTRKLSDVYRYVLTHDQNDTVSIEKELLFIRNYTEILQMRYGSGLVFHFNIQEPDKQRAIPPMTLQVLIENAVKHNAISGKEPLQITLSSNGEELTVANNIVPRIRIEPGMGIGLDNLIKKYRILTGKPVKIEKGPHLFTVKLPLL